MSVFEQMCKTLGFTFWPLSRGDYKALSIERYYRFLNETQTIVGQNCWTYQIFLENCKTSQYAWNSTPIDTTDIPCCIAAVGHHFKFLMDIGISLSPTFNNSPQSTLLNYVRDVSIDSQFATSVLQVH